MCVGSVVDNGRLCMVAALASCMRCQPGRIRQAAGLSSTIRAGSGKAAPMR
jgi:hypothetical protein